MGRCRSRGRLPAAVVGGLLAPGAVANGLNGVTFLFPTGGEKFFFPNTVVNISYITPFVAPQLFTWCGTFGGGVRHIRTEFVRPYSSFHLTPINFTNTDKCWFNLRPNASEGFGDNTDGFFILADDSARPTTVGLAPLAPTPGPAPVAANPSTAVTAVTTLLPGAGNTATPAADQPGPHALGSGAIAGISAGATLVAAIVIAAALAFWWARRKHPQKAEEKPLVPPASGPGHWQPPSSLSSIPSHCQDPSARGGTPPHLTRDDYFAVPSANASEARTSGIYQQDAQAPTVTDVATSSIGTSRNSHSSYAAGVAAASVAPVAPVPPTAVREAAELPSEHTHRGWGSAQEMPVSRPGASLHPPPGRGTEAIEQKFLLQDMHAFKTQRAPANASGHGPGPGPYFAG